MSEEIKRKIENLQKEYEETKKIEEQRVLHHKTIHRKATTKYCPDCGTRLQDRCPKFMALGRDCGNWECEYCVRVYYC